jgi:ERCC4-type nuclease
MNSRDIKAALETFTIIVDSREQETPRLVRRLNQMECPHIRRKLDFGDYSAKVELPFGGEFSLEQFVCVERKMNYSELCSCFKNTEKVKNRERFAREFERAKAAGAKLYLLIEGATWEKAYNGDYRSQMTPKSLIASMTTWMARYPCEIIMCHADTSGKLIKEILYREMKEKLARIEEFD